MSSTHDVGSTSTTHRDAHELQCPHCGHVLPPEGARVSGLEAEVRTLQQQAVDAVTRLADYESEISRLRAAASARKNSDSVGTLGHKQNASSQGSGYTDTDQHRDATNNDVSDPAAAPATPPQQRPGIGRLHSLLGRRGAAHSAQPSITHSSPTSASSSAVAALQAALARETALRQDAERKVAQVNGEIEDLSQTLFEQANEMVATERREKKRLEERIEVLEERDRDKGRRLERIEANLKRVERVRLVLKG
ncbi:hypothetical protein H2203_002986 [Taxawa tesnikishii (nom. ined.)]|nr:hypothetical protein H2203_002986 [Dothideales sp. JES 119]